MSSHQENIKKTKKEEKGELRVSLYQKKRERERNRGEEGGGEDGEIKKHI